MGRGRRPRFSPDGEWLAYWVGFSTGDPTSPGSNKIFIVPSGGGTPRQLVPHFESALYPVWSPDGKRVLFLGADSAANTRSTGALTGTNRPVNRWTGGSRRWTTDPPVKTGGACRCSETGPSVWASSGAGTHRRAWVGPENRVISPLRSCNADTFRDRRQRVEYSVYRASLARSGTGTANDVRQRF